MKKFSISGINTGIFIEIDLTEDQFSEITNLINKFYRKNN